MESYVRNLENNYEFMNKNVPKTLLFSNQCLLVMYKDRNQLMI